MKIYTKTGDKGQTALVSGKRVSKSDIRIDLYGEVDELNSRIGVLVSLLQDQKKFKKEIVFIQNIQNVLFDLGANLACEADLRKRYKMFGIPAAITRKLEKLIDEMTPILPELKNFILPGGTLTASQAHLCRTCARSVERKLVLFFEETQEVLPENSLEFLNRLSDYFFVFARYVNLFESEKEILWKPYKN